MDFVLVVSWLFIGVSILYVVHFALYLMGANFYDVWQQRRKSLVSAWYPGRNREECAATAASADGSLTEVPGLVSIVVAAHNEESVIIRTLDSILRSTYRFFEILVADDASTDNTGQLVRDYQLRHPDVDLRIIEMSHNVGKGAALNAALRKLARGQYVMTLDADSIIEPDAISNALSYFDDPDVAGVAANVQILHERSMISILQRFEHLIGYRSKKLYSLLNCEFVVGGVASTYRMRVLRKVGFYDTDTQTEDIGLSAKITRLGNRRFRMVYGADVVAKTEGVLTLRALAKQRHRWKYGSIQNLVKYRRMMLNPSRRYTRSLTFYRMPMAVLSEAVLLASPPGLGIRDLLDCDHADARADNRRVCDHLRLHTPHCLDGREPERTRTRSTVHLCAGSVLPVLHHGDGATDCGDSLFRASAQPLPSRGR